MSGKDLIVEQGDIFWVDLGEPAGSDPGYRRPCVVVQNNLYNISRLNTVVVCVLTSNMRLAKMPGNVLLLPEETGLQKPSVANISQLFTIDKGALQEKVGNLPDRRTAVILRGIIDLLRPRN
jgi:mRNA interferase MazF